MKFLKNVCATIRYVYIFIRYFGFNFFRAVWENYKEDKDSYENFAECLQEELYAMADS